VGSQSLELLLEDDEVGIHVDGRMVFVLGLEVLLPVLGQVEGQTLQRTVDGLKDALLGRFR
jgi:hypothetical protein